MITSTLLYWLKGIRFYIAVMSLLVTGLVIWWADVSYAGTILYPTRLEETFAWLATGLIVVAIAIGPLYKLLPSLPGRSLLFDARRLIGVSAAWFATLHVGIAFGALFKFANPLTLPSTYQKAFLLGIIALLILLAMAFTSFDKAFSSMGIWWFRLHRLVYVAISFVLLHAFIIGTHANDTVPLAIITIGAVLFLGMYGYVGFIRGNSSRLQMATILCMMVFIAVILTYGFSRHQAVLQNVLGGR